jgi:Uncharacterised protein family UPF0102
MRTAEARRRATDRRGRWAERVALALLMLKGYRPLARRYAASGGEIDLVVKRGGTIAFVEVKARGSLDAAREAISARKRQRLSRAARLGGPQPLGCPQDLAGRRRLHRAESLAGARRGGVRAGDGLTGPLDPCGGQEKSRPEERPEVWEETPGVQRNRCKAWTVLNLPMSG